MSLRTFSTALIRQGVPVTRPLQNWGDAIALLFSALRDQPRTVVIDEFPFLVKASPSLPSHHPAGARPGRFGASERRATAVVRLGHVGHGRPACRAGPAARPGQPRTADPPVRLHRCRPVLGCRPTRSLPCSCMRSSAVPLLTGVSLWPSTPRPASRTSTHGSSATVLNPQSPLFREARYLLAEETEIRDPALYHSVLGAIAGRKPYERRHRQLRRPQVRGDYPSAQRPGRLCAHLQGSRPVSAWTSDLPGHRAADYLL